MKKSKNLFGNGTLNRKKAYHTTLSDTQKVKTLFRTCKTSNYIYAMRIVSLGFLLFKRHPQLIKETVNQLRE